MNSHYHLCCRTAKSAKKIGVRISIETLNMKYVLCFYWDIRVVYIFPPFYISFNSISIMEVLAEKMREEADK